MQVLLVAMLMLLAIAGCAKKEESSAGTSSEAKKESVGGTSQYMAYEHIIRLDVEEKRVAIVHETVQAACREAVTDQCVILESRLATGRYASADLKFRAKPSGIKKLIAILSSEGEIINRSVVAEDLADPIEDSAKKLAMLNDYRSKLEALRGRASSDVDALIKVNKELALVQSEIETMAGERAHLVQRIETEILNVAISSIHNRSFFSPVAEALSNFSNNLSNGISSAITGIAFIIPWGLTLLMFWWAGRKLWLRRKKTSENA